MAWAPARRDQASVLSTEVSRRDADGTVGSTAGDQGQDDGPLQVGRRSSRPTASAGELPVTCRRATVIGSAGTAEQLFVDITLPGPRNVGR